MPKPPYIPPMPEPPETVVLREGQDPDGRMGGCGFATVVIVALAFFGFGLWCMGQASITEVRRVTLDVESVEYEGGQFAGYVTVLRLKGGGTYLLNGMRSVPSGRVEISVTADGEHHVIKNR